MALKTKPAVKPVDANVVDVIATGYVPVRQLSGVVTGVWGKALLRTANGEMRPIKVGDVVQPGDVVLTKQDGIVELDGGPASAASVARDARGRPLVAPPDASEVSAGADGAGELVPGLRVARINETVALPTVRVSFDETLDEPRPLTPTESETGGGDATASVPEADSSQIAATEEGAPVNLGLRAPNDPQGSSANLVVIVTQLPQIGQILRADGSPLALGDRLDPAEVPGLVYLPPADYNAGTPVGVFGYSVSNGTNTTSGGTLIEVQPVNDAPIARNDGPLSTPEDTTLSGINVLGNDSDIDGDALTVTAATSPDGTVVINPDGTLGFAPAPNFNGPTTITYTVSDGNGGSATATVVINVTPVSDLAATDDNFSATEDLPLAASVAGNDSTSSGGTLSFAKATDPAHGTLVFNADGSFVYTPAANYNGPDSFSYMVTDAASGESATRTVNLTVNPVTDLVAANDAFTAIEDLPLGASVAGNDSTTSGGVLSFAKATDPAHGTLVLNADGSFVYTPAANYNGSDSFTYTVTDAVSGESATRSVDLTVQPRPDLSAGDDNFSATEDLALSASVAGNDSTTSGGTLAFAKTTDPTHGTLVLNADGSFVYTPTANYNGPDSFTYTVTDAASGESATRTVNLTVNPVQDLLAADDSFTAVEDLPLAASVAGNDSTSSGGTLSFAKATDPAHGTVVFNADGSFVYTPTANYNGPDSFSYTVTDAASGESATRTVDLTVQTRSDLTAADDAFTTNEDLAVNASVALNDSTTSGGALSFAKTTDPVHGTLVFNADGSFVYTPALNYNGPDSFTYTVTDAASGESATRTVSLDVNPVADLLAADDNFILVEDLPRSASVATNDSTTSGGALSFAKATDPIHGTVVFNADGSFVYTPTANYNGPDSFTYTVTDATSGESDTRTVNLSVVPQTDLTAADDAFTTNEDLLVSGSVALNDSTTSGGTLSFAKATDPANGTLVFNTDGSFVYTPAANFNGTDSFTYTVTDSASGEVAVRSVEITVNPVTDLLAANDAFGTAEDVVLSASVASNDSTTSGGVLSFVKTTDPSNGTVVFNADGSFVYTPTANYNGPDSFTYAVTDVASGESATRTVNLTVGAVPDLIAADDNFAALEDLALSASVAANDSTTSGGVLSFVKATDPSNGTVVFNADGSFVYTPTANYNGPDSFTYTVTDAASGESATRTVNLTVNPAPDLVATNDAFSVNEDLTLSASVATNDSTTSGGALAFAKTTDPTNGSVVFNADGSFVYTPTANYNGPDSFTYTVTDAASGESATRTVNLTVDPVTDLAATDDAFSVNEDLTRSASVATNDSTTSGGALAFAKTTDPTNGSVVFNADGSFVYTPTANYNGPDSFTYTVTDAASGESATRTVNLTVDPVTDLTANNDAFSVNEDLTLSASVAANDSTTSGGALAFAKTTDPTNGSVVFNADGSFVYTPALNYNGPDSFTYTVTDAASGESATRTVSLTVNPASDLVATDDSFSVNEDLTLSASVATNDSTTSGGTLSFVKATDPAHGSVVLNADGSFVYTPVANYNGPDSFTYTVTDAASGESATRTVNLTVDPVTDLTATDDAFSVNEDLTRSASVATNDSTTSGGALAFAKTTDPTNGTVVFNADGSFVYTPTANYNGPDSFTYTVTDVASGESATRTVNLTVDPVTDLAATNDAFSVNEDLTLSASVATNDSTTSGGSLAFAKTTDPTNGSVVFNADGSFVYTPTANYNGTDSFTYTVTDVASGESATRTVSLTVDPVNDAPLAVNDSATAVEAGGVANGTAGSNPSGNVLANDTDVDSGDTKTVSAISGSAAGTVGGPTAGSFGTLTLNADGSYGYVVDNSLAAVQALNVGGTLTDTFSYTMRDAAGATSTATLTVTVQGANDAPLAANVSASGFEDPAARIAINLAGSDVDGSIASYQLAALAANGSLFAAATGGAALAVGATLGGTVYFQPNANWNGSTSFLFQARDNSGALSGAAATATIMVAPVNDAPTLTGLGPTLNYLEATTATVTRTLIDGTVVLADIDSANFGGGSLTVAIANVVVNQDLLDVRNQGNAAGQIGVAGSNVSYGGVLIGTLSGGTGGAPLVISLNASATVAAVDALIQNVRYGNQAQLPNITPRNVSFTVVDGDGTANGGADTRVINTTINVASRNDAPSLAGLGGLTAVAYTENGTPTVLDGNATIIEPELGSTAIGGLNNMGGATLTLVRSTGANAQDQFVGSGTLVLSGGNVVLGGVTVGSYNTAQFGNGQLAITFANGTTNAQANSVLQQIAYQNSSDTPPASVRINFTINDGNTGVQGSGGARAGAVGSVLVNITPFNDAPVANPDSATAVEAGGVGNGTAGINPSGNVLGNDTDPESSALSVQSFSFGAAPGTLGSALAGAYGSLVLNANGSYTYTVDNNNAAVQALLNAGTTLTETFNYTARDAAGKPSASTTLTITIQGANDTPVAVANSDAVDEDAAVARSALLGVLSNDTDVDSGDSKTVAAVSGVAAGTVGGSTVGTYGTLTLNADGSYSYVADQAAADPLGLGQSAIDSFSYTVRDNAGATSTTTLNFTVSGVNDAPLAVADTATAVEASGAANGTAGTNPSGNVLTNDTDIDSGDSKAVSAVSFGATTGTLGSALAGAYGSLVLNADGSYGYTVDNSNLAVQALLQASDTLSDSFSYTMRDAAGATSTTTLTVTIEGRNDAPTAPSATINAVEEGPDVSMTPATLPFDIDSPSITIRVTQLPTIGSVLLVVGGLETPVAVGQALLAADFANLVYRPPQNYTPGDPVGALVYEVNDGAFTSTGTLSVVVTAIDDAPRANGGSASGNEDASFGNPGNPALAVSLTGSDVDNAISAVTVTQLPANGTLYLADGSTPVVAGAALTPAQAAALVFVPAPDYFGSTTLQFTVTADNGVVSPAAGYTLIVAPVNDAPVVSSTVINAVEEGAAVSLGLSAPTDVDDSTLVITVTGLPDPTLGKLLLDINDPTSTPLIGQILTAAQLQSLVYVPPAEYYNGGAALPPVGSFTYEVTDNKVTVTGSALINLTPVNDRPVADNVSAALPAVVTDSVLIELRGSDVDGTIDRFIIGSLPPAAAGRLERLDGTLVLAGQQFAGPGPVQLRFRPAPGFDDTTSFTYRVIDDQGGVSLRAIGSIDYSGVAGSGNPIDQIVVGLEDTEISLSSLPDGEPGDTVTITDLPDNGVLLYPDGTPVAPGTTLTLDQVNDLRYVPNPNFNGNDSIGFTFDPADGPPAPGNVTLVVKPVPDAPVAVDDSVDPTAVIKPTEDTPFTFNVLGNDVDADAGQSALLRVSAVNGQPVTVGGAPVAVTGGSVTLNADGTLLFTPAPDFNGAVSFDYTVTDPDSLSDTGTVNFVVAPVNDAPVAVADAIETDEDTPFTFNPAANDTDVDLDPLRVSAVGTPAHGTVVLNPDGTVTYTPSANYNGPDSFTYTVTDDQGGVTTGTVTVNVKPVNDAPVSSNGSATTTEDTPRNGSLPAATDPDGDPVTYALNGGALPQHGTVIVNADGTYSYTPDPDYFGSDSFGFTVTDGQGGSNSYTFSLTVTPVNDAPVTLSTTLNVFEEDAAVLLGAAATDPDFDPITITVLELPATGLGVVLLGGSPVTVGQQLTAAQLASLTYLAPTDYDGLLPAGSFRYRASDGALTTDGEIVINLQPLNDAPVNTVPGPQTATEDVLQAITGLSIADVDAASGSMTVTLEVTNGTLVVSGGSATIADSGTSTVTLTGTIAQINATLAATVNYLPTADFNGSATLTMTTTDNGNTGSGGAKSDVDVVLITIGAVNDAPVNTLPASIAVTEDQLSPLTGLSITDIDAGSAPVSVTLSVPAGSLLAASGAGVTVSGSVVSLVLTGSVADINTFLAAGQVGYLSAPDANGAVTLTMTTDDGGNTGSGGPLNDIDTVTLNITAVNDVPVMSVGFGAVTEDSAAVASGTLTISDPDPGETAFQPQSGIATPYGTFSVAANGAWSYALNSALPAVQALGVGATLTDTITVLSADGTPTSVTITINGANDAPVAQAAAFTVAEDAAPVAGSVLASDVDANNSSLSYALTAAAPAGLVFNADGSYSFDPGNAAYQSLGVGQSVVFTIAYTATDDQGAVSNTANFVITVTGTNDLPVAVADAAPALEAGGVANGTLGLNVAGNVLVNDTDVDAGDTKTVSAITGGTVGSALAGSYGTLELNADGSYVYRIDNTNPLVEALRDASTTLTDSFSYTMRDAAGVTSSATLTITILGANDAPVAVADTATAAEAGGVANGTAGSNAVGNVLANDTDVDAGDTKTVSAIVGGTVGTALVGTYGTLTLNADGSYSYVVDNANATVQALRTAGDTLSEAFTYTMRDAAGATSSATLTITILGANDAPVAVADTANPVEAGGVNNGTPGLNVAGNVLANDTDVDAGDTKTVSAVSGAAVGVVGGSTAGSYGSLELNADGSYVYRVDNLDPLVQALRDASTTLTDSFSYTIQDTFGVRSSTTLTITISGANDAPVAVADTATAAEAGGVANGTAGSNAVGNVLANDTDVDAGDTKTVSAIVGGTVGTALVGTYGTLTLNADGSYSYVVDNANATVQALRTAGDTLSEAFTYTMRDAAGATSSATLTITILGANDAPVAVADTANPVEAGGVNNGTPGLNVAGNVLANDTDVDAGDTKTVSAVSGAAVGVVGGSTAGSYGSLELNADGSYVYRVDNLDPLVQALRDASTTLTDSFSYTIQDTFGVRSSTTLTITISGANDAPVAVADTANPVEAGGVNNGTLGINVAGNVLANDTDVDAGDTKTVSAIVGGTLGSGLTGAYGTLTLNADGSYVYIVDNANAAVEALRSAADTLTDAFTYTMRDAAGATSTTTLTITIAGANDSPLATNDSASIDEDGTLTIAEATLLTNDSDVDGGPLSITSVQSAVNGTVAFLAGNVVFTPTANYNGPASFSYTVDDGLGGTSTATVDVTVNPVNDAPVARPDTGSLDAGTTLTINAANGVIQSIASPSGRDTDVDSPVLSVTLAGAGATAGTAVIAAGTSIVGTYGTLTIRPDGSYVYRADQAAAVATGTNVTDVFSYAVSDGALTSITTLTLTVAGQADTVTAAAPTTTTLTSTLGLNAEYYGYNQSNSAGTNRRHSDDGSVGNIDNVADITAIINGRAGSSIVGTFASATATATDARFLANRVDYGSVTGDLGVGNPNVGANGTPITSGKFYNFLATSGGSGAATLTASTGPGAGSTAGTGPTTGFGSSTDAIIRISGIANFDPGLYDVRVTADDGFRWKSDGFTIAGFDGNQGPTLRTYTGVPLAGGLSQFEVLYWDQGGEARLKLEFSVAGSNSWKVLGSDSLPIFSAANAPVLGPNQEIIDDPGTGGVGFLVRTGSIIDGGLGNDTLTGNIGPDVLRGGAGNDTLNGGASGRDQLIGGAGDDLMFGSRGTPQPVGDVFKWDLADRGSAGTPAIDTLRNFENRAWSGDVLELRDLLQGESHLANTLSFANGTNNPITIGATAGNIDRYLHFSYDGANTIIQISSSGAFAGGATVGNQAPFAGSTDQRIVLEGINLVGASTTDQQVIIDLFRRGTLVTD